MVEDIQRMMRNEARAAEDVVASGVIVQAHIAALTHLPCRAISQLGLQVVW